MLRLERTLRNQLYMKLSSGKPGYPAAVIIALDSEEKDTALQVQLVIFSITQSNGARRDVLLRNKSWLMLLSKKKTFKQQRNRGTEICNLNDIPHLSLAIVQVIVNVAEFCIFNKQH